nr:MAG TPA: hypothetical protein [Caudoviricetes sp.]
MQVFRGVSFTNLNYSVKNNLNIKVKDPIWYR